MKATLVAVIGPVPPHVFVSWIGHYRDLGVGCFRLAFHSPPDKDSVGRLEALLSTAAALGVRPAATIVRPWDEQLNPAVRDRLRQESTSDIWQLFADVDEYHQYPRPLQSMLEEAEERGELSIRGCLVDRVASNGELVDWPDDGIHDRAFGLGGFLTSRVLGGDPRKVVAARPGVRVSGGQHHVISPGSPTESTTRLCLVHHFKWHGEVVQYLERRLEAFLSGDWIETSPAMRLEASRLLNHLASNEGRIDIAASGFRACSLSTANCELFREAESEYCAWSFRLQQGGVG